MLSILEELFLHDKYWWGCSHATSRYSTLHDTEYFKLKEREKQHIKEELAVLLLKQVIRPSCVRCPPYIQRKRTLIISKDESKKNLNKWGLLVSPSLLHLVHNTCSTIFFHNISLFIKPNIKIIRWTMSYGLHFLMEHIKNKCVCIFSCESAPVENLGG